MHCDVCATLLLQGPDDDESNAGCGMDPLNNKDNVLEGARHKREVKWS